MKKISKITSVVLAIILVCTLFVMPTSAAGDYVPELTFTVAKDEAHSTTEYDVYGVTLSIELGKYAIAMMYCPIVYDATLFTPGRYNSKTGVNSYTTAPSTSGVNANFAQTYTGEYDSDNIDYSFLEDGVTKDYDMNYDVSPVCDANITITQAHISWVGSLDQTKYKAGLFYFQPVEATRYMNANGEKVDVVTVYFFTPAGTNVTGAEFGVLDGAVPADIVLDASGNAHYVPTEYKEGNPTSVSVTNAVVEESRTPLAFSEAKEQIRFQKNTDGTYAGKFDYRLITNITNFSTVFAGYTNDQLDDKTAPVVKGAGYYFLVGGAAPTVETLKLTGTSVTVNGIATGTAYGDYVMACVVTDIPDADKGEALHAVAYVTYELDGETYTDYSDVMTSESFDGLYSQYYNIAFPSA